MDDAGGHGIKVAIQQYIDNLLTNYNIRIIWQVPRSPYTNVLDLGAWISLQALVERRHYLKRCTTDALVSSVKVWSNTDLVTTLIKVFDKLRVVFL